MQISDERAKRLGNLLAYSGSLLHEALQYLKDARPPQTFLSSVAQIRHQMNRELKRTFDGTPILKEETDG